MHRKLAAEPCLCCTQPEATPLLRVHLPALQAETLVGVMSDRALDALIDSKGKFTMSSNW